MFELMIVGINSQILWTTKFMIFFQSRLRPIHFANFHYCHCFLVSLDFFCPLEHMQWLTVGFCCHPPCKDICVICFCYYVFSHVLQKCFNTFLISSLRCLAYLVYSFTALRNSIFATWMWFSTSQHPYFTSIKKHWYKTSQNLGYKIQWDMQWNFIITFLK